jgi:BirA family biotin operon repressor/biotin-[acetyl-CoA-carboxylase] ligase
VTGDDRESSIGDEIAVWPDRLEAACAGTRFDSALVRVVAQCDSTQDLARTLGRGAVVTTGRQVGGRGRLGRAWLDDEGAGIAISLGVEAADPAVLALAAGLAARAAVVEACHAVSGRLALKHPNDHVDRVTAGKVGGVLVEADHGIAVIGIGINVHPRSWPEDIPAIAVADLRGPWPSPAPPPSRLSILERLVPALDRLLDLPVDRLADHFAADHAPTGRLVTLETSEGEHRGRLVGFDPRSRIEIEDDRGVRRGFPAVTTRLLAWSPSDDPVA